MPSISNEKIGVVWDEEDIKTVNRKAQQQQVKKVKQPILQQQPQQLQSNQPPSQGGKPQRMSKEETEELLLLLETCEPEMFDSATDYLSKEADVFEIEARKLAFDMDLMNPILDQDFAAIQEDVNNLENKYSDYNNIAQSIEELSLDTLKNVVAEFSSEDLSKYRKQELQNKIKSAYFEDVEKFRKELTSKLN